MIDPDVRTAEPADVTQLVHLEAEARSALVDQRGGARWLEEHPLIGEGWLERLASDTVFVASIDDVLVGYAVVVDDSPDDQSGRSGLRAAWGTRARLRRRDAGGRRWRTPRAAAPSCSRGRHSPVIVTPRTSTSAPGSRLA